jgi:hypothetical protein
MGNEGKIKRNGKQGGKMNIRRNIRRLKKNDNFRYEVIDGEGDYGFTEGQYVQFKHS